MLNGFGGENVTFMHRTVSNIQQVKEFVAKAELMGSGGAKHKTFDRHGTQIMDENFEYGCSVLVKFNNTTVLLTMEPFVLDCGESALSREGTFQDIEFENIYLSNKCYCTPSTSRMFSHCKVKNELDISGVDSTNMMNASNMFEGLYVGGKVSGMSTLKTNNLVAANGMFKGCNLWRSTKSNEGYGINLSNFELKKLTTAEEVFMNAKLKYVTFGKNMNLDKLQTVTDAFREADIGELNIDGLRVSSLIYARDILYKAHILDVTIHNVNLAQADVEYFAEKSVIDKLELVNVNFGKREYTHIFKNAMIRRVISNNSSISRYYDDIIGNV